ncbi:prevent-host-death protein [Desulfitobacterium sp. Sab5]|uniref:prevent-host-death protein n=1 Tax=Desulfitobacterium nosdiversum TaxID=3375356 RepID=UPI003CF9D483
MLGINIKPSAEIRKNYNNIESFVRRESMLRLREHLIDSEEGRLNGKTGYSVDEVTNMMKAAVKETLHGHRS